MKAMTLVRLLTFGIILSFSLTSNAQSTLNIYMNPNGNDLNNGTLSAPLLTLSAAQTVAKATYLASPSSYNKIVINIMPGIYSGQSVVWSFVANSGATPIIIQAYDQVKKPIFDGGGTVASAFFYFRYYSAGGETGLTLRNLAIKYYLTAMDIRGHSTDFTKYSSGTIIENNLFDRIGSAYGPSTSTAALRLMNTRNNIIRGNVFSRIDDIDASATGLHAIYAADFVIQNTISNNVFQNIKSGQVVKFRNQSDNNLVSSNSFINVRNWSSVYNWYSTTSVDSPECPNYGIQVNDNRVVLGSNSPVPSGSTKPSLYSYNSANALYTEWPFTSSYVGYCPSNIISNLLSQESSGLITRATFTTNYSQGCFMTLDNCPRFLAQYANWNNLFEFKDINSNAQLSSATCSNRAGSLYASCSDPASSGTAPGTPQMVRARYLGETTLASEKISAHGCVLTASSCEYMGFNAPNSSKLDALTRNSHTSQTSCMARAKDYYDSCAPSLTGDDLKNLKIKASYFQNGSLISEKSYP